MSCMIWNSRSLSFGGEDVVYTPGSGRLKVRPSRSNLFKQLIIMQYLLVSPGGGGRRSDQYLARIGGGQKNNLYTLVNIGLRQPAFPTFLSVPRTARLVARTAERMAGVSSLCDWLKSQPFRICLFGTFHYCEFLRNEKNWIELLMTWKTTISTGATVVYIIQWLINN